MTTTPAAREPMGTPTGGQFAATEHAETTATLKPFYDQLDRVENPPLDEPSGEDMKYLAFAEISHNLSPVVGDTWNGESRITARQVLACIDQGRARGGAAGERREYRGDGPFSATFATKTRPKLCRSGIGCGRFRHMQQGYPIT